MRKEFNVKRKDARPRREGSHLVDTIADTTADSRGRDIILQLFSIYNEFLYFVKYVSVFGKR